MICLMKPDPVLPYNAISRSETGFRNRAFARWFAFAASLWLSLGSGAAAADQVKIGGTGAALGVVRQLAKQFIAQHPEVQITFLPNLGSAGGIRALAGGAIDIALISRPMTASERSSGFAEIEFARTPFVFAVSAKSTVNSLTLAELADIYAGKLTRWADGTPVRVVLRPASDIDSEMIKSMSSALRRGLDAAEKRRGVKLSVTDQDAANDLETIPGAIGPSTLAVIISEGRALRALKLEGKEPTLVNAVSGDYPYYKRLYLVARVDRSATVEGFIAFVRSSAAQSILAANGCWKVGDRR